MPLHRIVRALFEFQAAEEDELTLNEGELLDVVPSEDNHEWLMATKLNSLLALDGENQNSELSSGLVPANHVEDVEPLALLHAAHSYKPEDEDTDDIELAFEKNQPLYLLDRLTAGWWLVKTESGSIGLIPSNYLATQTDEKKEALAQAIASGEGESEDPLAEYIASVEKKVSKKVSDAGNMPTVSFVKQTNAECDGKQGTLGLTDDGLLIFLAEGIEALFMIPSKQVALYEDGMIKCSDGRSIPIHTSDDSSSFWENLLFEEKEKEQAVIKQEEKETIIEPPKMQIATLASRQSPPLPTKPAVPNASVESASLKKSSEKTQSTPTTSASPPPPPPPPKPISPSMEPRNKQVSPSMPVIPSPANAEAIKSAFFPPEIVPQKAPENKIEEPIKGIKNSKPFQVSPSNIGQLKENTIKPTSTPSLGQQSTSMISNSIKPVESKTSPQVKVNPISGHLPSQAEQKDIKSPKSESEEPVTHCDTTEFKSNVPSSSSPNSKPISVSNNPWSKLQVKKPSTAPLKKASTSTSVAISAAGKSAPVVTLPKPGSTRLWTDRTGKFQVEAEYLSFNSQSGQVELLKLNGKTVKVPLEMLAESDVKYVYLREGIEVETNSNTPADSNSWLGLLLSLGIARERASKYAEKLKQLGKEVSLHHLSTREVMRAHGFAEADILVILKAHAKQRTASMERTAADRNMSLIKSMSRVSLEDTEARHDEMMSLVPAVGNTIDSNSLPLVPIEERDSNRQLMVPVINRSNRSSDLISSLPDMGAGKVITGLKGTKTIERTRTTETRTKATLPRASSADRMPNLKDRMMTATQHQSIHGYSNQQALQPYQAINQAYQQSSPSQFHSQQMMGLYHPHQPPQIIVQPPVMPTIIQPPVVINPFAAAMPMMNPMMMTANPLLSNPMFNPMSGMMQPEITRNVVIQKYTTKKGANGGNLSSINYQQQPQQGGGMHNYYGNNYPSGSFY